ncbi:hypothetical protein G9A89_022274 [Geosiphon pyriformis]|nr:hypothetical protein G9A89_022274 [Geosiphon pyriformis]
MLNNISNFVWFNGVWVFTSGLESDHLGAGVVVIMNFSLTRHVSRVSEMSGWLFSIKLLFKDKILVSILGLYAGAFSVVQFSKAGKINFFIMKAANKSSFVILGGDFNEDGSHKCSGHQRTYLEISKYFDMDHKAVFMSVGLNGLLNTWLNYFHKQVNKDWWKFNFKNADVIQRVMVFLANEIFKKKWFRNNNYIFTKRSSKFHRLELLVLKIVKIFHGDGVDDFVSLMEFWCFLDGARASIVQNLVDFDASFNCVHSVLSGARKSYHALKLADSLRAKEMDIKSTIDKRIKSFEMDKSHTIKSVLECSFRKMVLDYLVVDDKLVLEPSLVKSKVDTIMKSWIWKHQTPLEHVFDGAFSGVLCLIDFEKFFGVVFNLPDGKAAGLLDISNELWKHCDKSILDMLLVLLNCCLISSACSTFDVFREDNFLVLKDTTTQSPIFAIGLVIENALKKDQELWLVLQDMRKAYDLIDSCQNATQHILNIVSEFFQINDISINNKKTMAILINSKISNSFLFISGSPITIAKKEKSYQYLGIFFSIEGFSKPSLAKVHLDQFLYLVLVVLHSIVSYRIQFSFVPIGVCNKWDTLICKSLKLKFALPLDFLSNTIHHPSFYGLKIFLQIHASNNFLASMICILLDCNLFLSSLMASSFQFYNGVPMSAKRLDPKGPVPYWFKLSVVFFDNVTFFPSCFTILCGVGPLIILKSSDFVSICNHLLQVDVSVLSMYIDGSMKNFGSVNCNANIAAFFEDIGLGLGVGVMGLMSSILAELQAIALALECVLLSSSVCLFSDSQSAFDACKSELGLACPDFRNQYWIEHQHISNVIYSKNLKNECANVIVGIASLSGWWLPSHVNKCFIVADSNMVFGNSKYFVGSGCKFLENSLLSEIDWICSSLVWHPDLHMATGFTSRLSANTCTYFMKALHYHLPVVIWKHLYNRLYLSVLCLYCSKVEVLDYAFFYRVDKTLFDSFHASLCVLQLLLSCNSGSSVSMALFKGFVFDGWFWKVISVFHDSKLAGLEIVKFVCFLSLAFRDNVWLVHAKHHAYMKKHGLIPSDGSAIILVSGLSSEFSTSMMKLLGMADAFGICFGFCKSCLFFSGLGGSVSVHIAV